jgi:hypothetical protein
MTALALPDSDSERFRRELVALQRKVASLIERMKRSAAQRTRFRTPPAKLNGAFGA